MTWGCFATPSCVRRREELLAMTKLREVIYLQTLSRAFSPNFQHGDLGGMIERRGISDRIDDARFGIANKIFGDWNQFFDFQITIFT